MFRNRKSLFLSLIMLMLISTSVFAERWNIYAGADQKTLEAIKTCDGFIAEQKYQSAVNAVGACNNEYMIYKYIEVCTQYFAQSMMHTMFAFKNLSEGETLHDVRTKDGSFNLTFRDEPDKIIDDYKSAHGNSMLLELARANYYFDALMRYGNQWLKTPDEILTLVKDVYSRAVAKEVYDERVINNYASLFFNEKNWAGAEKLYALLAEHDSINGSYWYNLTVAKMWQEKYKESIEPAKMAVDNPEEDPNNHLDAYTILADAYAYSGDFENAEKTLFAAHEKYNYQPIVFQRLAELYLIHKDNYNFEKGEAYLDQVLTVVCDSTTIFNCIKVYMNLSAPDKAIDFCTRNMKKYKDKKCQGYFNYFLAQLYAITGDKTKTYKALDEAKKIFKNLKDEQWLNTCESLKAELDKMN